MKINSLHEIPSDLFEKIFATLDVANKRVCIKLSEVDRSVFSTKDKTIVYPVPNKWGKAG